MKQDKLETTENMRVMISLYDSLDALLTGLEKIDSYLDKYVSIAKNIQQKTNVGEGEKNENQI